MKLLSTLSKRFSAKTEDDLREEIQSLKDELRAFSREHDGRIREQRHAVLDRKLTDARIAADRILLHAEQGAVSELTLAADASAFLALRDEQLVEALHDAVDAATDFSDLSLREFETRLAGLKDEIQARELELERREAAARLAEAQRGLADVAEKAEA